MAIGEVFLSAFLQVLFEQMLLIGGSKFLKFIGGDDLPKTIKKWKNQFAKLEAQLEDAELQQFHRKPVKLWLNKVQDLAYDIEDILDHIATEARRDQLQQAVVDQVNSVDGGISRAGFLDVVQNYYANSSRAALSAFFTPDHQDKIGGITERLQDLENEMHTLNLTAHKMQHQTIQTETLRSQRESTSLVGKVFGRDDEKQDIITMLLKDNQKAEGYVVIPIVGTGGIGKTTIAQYVYNDEQRYVYRDEQLYDEQHKSNFDIKAWVCVSDVFDIKRVTIDIINSASQGNFGSSNLNQAQVKLQQVLNGKKFLIVLDDIWSENYANWEKLQIPFQGGAKGSRVIMTTRSKKIAMKMTKSQNTIISLQGLSGNNIWRLFQHHANEDNDDPDIKDDVVRKCKGLPLAAKALGGLLKSTTEKSQRRQILESNVWGEEYEECEVLPVLQLSYHHMPSHLKRVFAYCSVFPKDYEFKEMELVLLWMAQGFLPETQNERMEDMGHKYFNDLASRSLFEKVSSDEGRYIMHDLIHDVARLAAGDVCYVMNSKSSDFERLRHSFFIEHVPMLVDLIFAPQLRTLLVKKVVRLDIIERMHYIRALHLVSEETEVLPECIGDLIHLRYLSLKFGRIKVLPQSINNLWNLQTLCLDRCFQLEKIPHIGSLEKLRHMYIMFRDMNVTFLNLGEPPLREMPLGIGKLTNLQTLSTFPLAPGSGSRIRDLGRLNHLHGSLFICGLECVTKVDDAHEAQFHKKECVEELLLKWRTCTIGVDDKTKRDVIEKLQPHNNIQKCEFEGYMGSTFPSWLGDPSFSNMVYIKLNMCHKCEWLPPLGQLPSLKSLWISDMVGIKEVGLEFYGHCSTPFPSLNTLHFSSMESWEKWVHPPVNSKTFPILEKLNIMCCPSLQGDLPPHLPSLTTLYIVRCWKLQSLELKNSSSSHLENLQVNRCGAMVSICHIPLTLQSLKIEDCEKLEYVEFDEQPAYLSPISDNEKGLKSEVGASPKASLELPLLTHFTINKCPSLRSLQQNLILSALARLDLLYSEKMERLPAQLLNFTSLKELRIDGSPKIQSFPEGGLPRNLTSVVIRDVNIKQVIQEWRLHLLHSLEELELINVGSVVDSVECIEGPDLYLPSSSSSLENHDLHSLKPDDVGSSADSVECIQCPHLSLPSSLSTLNIESFQNLKKICCSTLPKLYGMKIKNCPKLESFGDNALPPHIKYVKIEECDMIELHLTSDTIGCIETKNGRFSVPPSGS